MKKLLFALALLCLPFVAQAAVPVTQVINGGTGSSTLSGILFGNGTSPIRTLTIGTNLSISGSTLNATGAGSSFSYPFPSNATSTNINFSSGLTVSGTSITGFTGVANSNIVLASSPTMTGTLNVPQIKGGVGTGSNLTLESTSGVGSADSITLKTGSQVTALTIDTNQKVTFANPITNGSLSGLIGASSGLTYAVSTSSLNASITGNAGTATALATGRTISITGDLAYTSPSFDGSGNVTAASTLATVNTNVGSFGGTNSIPTFTVNGKGLITAAGSATPSIPASEITNGTFGTGNYTFPADVTVTGNATSTALFATTASTTKLFGSNLQACTGTNALTYTGGLFGCAAVPQGTLTAIGVTTNQGVSGSSSGGTTPNLTLTLGALTGLTSLNGLVVTANTGVITTGTWNGTTIALANGGTNATSFNTSGNALYYDGTRLATALTTAKIVIPIASTTDITASGELGIPNAATSPTLNVGELAVDTNAASTSLRIGDGTATRSIYAAQTSSMVVSSSTLAYMGAYGTAGTTTILVQNAYHPTTILTVMCTTDVGTANVDFFDGTSRSNNVACSTTPKWITLTTNNTWVMSGKIEIDVGNEATNPNTITVTSQVRADSD